MHLRFDLAKLPLMATRSSLGWPSSVLLGLVILYGPTISSLLDGPWADARNAHGPVLMLVATWMLLRKVHRSIALKSASNPIGPTLLLGVGSLMYGLGRALVIPALEFGSLVPMVTGLLWLTLGLKVVKAAWFPLVLIALATPLPASVVEMVTHPMKMGASVVADQFLHLLGYPVARDGVVLAIGPYRLLVADACAGLKSLFVLEALGLVYINLMGYTERWRNITLAVCVVPIAFFSNALRIVLLAVITYHWGDAAAQGFLHDFSGLFLFMVALASIFLADSLLGTIKKPRAEDQAKKSAVPLSKDAWQHLIERLAPPRTAWLVWPLCIALAIFQAHLLSPTSHYQPIKPNLSQLFPKQFGDWVQIDSPFVQMSLSSDPNSTDQPYDQQWTGAYRNTHGDVLMVAAAYVHSQTQDIKLHQPEVCYTAQGFKVDTNSTDLVSMHKNVHNKRMAFDVPVHRFSAHHHNRQEWVSYWMRTGPNYVNTGLGMRKAIFLEGLSGNTVDGFLLRVSSLNHAGNSPEQAFDAHNLFMRDLVSSLNPQQKRFFVVGSAW